MLAARGPHGGLAWLRRLILRCAPLRRDLLGLNRRRWNGTLFAGGKSRARHRRQWRPWLCDGEGPFGGRRRGSGGRPRFRKEQTFGRGIVLSGASRKSDRSRRGERR